MKVKLARALSTAEISLKKVCFEVLAGNIIHN